MGLEYTCVEQVVDVAHPDTSRVEAQDQEVPASPLTQLYLTQMVDTQDWYYNYKTNNLNINLLYK